MSYNKCIIMDIYVEIKVYLCYVSNIELELATCYKTVSGCTRDSYELDPC